MAEGLCRNLAFDRFARSVSHRLRVLDTFRVLGIEFVSLSESLDTATPAGRVVFTVLGAVAELGAQPDRRARPAGLRNARANGKRLGRPRVTVDRSRIAALRSKGLSWAEIAKQIGVPETVCMRISGHKTRNVFDRYNITSERDPCRRGPEN